MRSDRNQANQLIENSLKEYKKSVGEVILVSVGPRTTIELPASLTQRERPVSRSIKSCIAQKYNLFKWIITVTPLVRKTAKRHCYTAGGNTVSCHNPESINHVRIGFRWF